MKRIFNNTKIITLIASFVLLIVLLIGFSYALFYANISGLESASTLSLTGGDIRINYTDGNTLSMNGFLPSPDPWASKEFTVTGYNTTILGVDYMVLLKINTNTFSSGAITYTLTNLEETGGTAIENQEDIPVTVSSGNQTIGLGHFTQGNNQIHRYRIDLYFLETGADQSIDMNKTFNATINIVDGTQKYSITYYPNRLPSAYQEVEYLESDGNQYILTNITPTDSTGVYMDFIMKNLSSTNRVLFGSGTPVDNSGYWAGTLSQGYFRWNQIYSSSQSEPYNIPDLYFSTTNHNILKFNYLNDRNVTINNTTYTTNLETLKTKTLPMVIFAYYNETYNDVRLFTDMKLYEFIVSNSDTIVANFVPCYRISDNKPGLYDLINDVFYTNQSNSSTDFTAGPIKKVTQEIVYNTSEKPMVSPYTEDSKYISSWNTKADGTGKSYSFEDLLTNNSAERSNLELYAEWSNKIVVTLDSNGGYSNLSNIKVVPNSTYYNLPTPTRSGYQFIGWSLISNDYQEVEYLTLDGTQYIDVGYNIKAGEDFEAKIYTETENTEMAIFGPTSGLGTLEIGISRVGRIMNWSSHDNVITITPTTSLYNKVFTFTASISDSSPNKTLSADLDGGLFSSGGIMAYSGSTTGLRLFNIQSNYGFIGRVYYIKIYDEGELIRDYKPCYRVNDNIAGLCDVKNNIFYPNNNSSGNNFGISGTGNTAIVNNDTTIEKNAAHTLTAIWQAN